VSKDVNALLIVEKLMDIHKRGPVDTLKVLTHTHAPDVSSTWFDQGGRAIRPRHNL
jgi:hypothetical protein